MQKKSLKLLRNCAWAGILWTSLCVGVHAKEVLYMLPYEQKEALNALKSALKGAKSEINISIYSFTHNDIAKILRDSAKRGVKVQIIFDKESNANNKGSTIGFLAKYNNIAVCLLSGLPSQNKRYYGIMHQKLAIIDRELLLLGSANWSKNAFENNFETLLISDNSALVSKALKAFERMRHACAGF